MVYNIVVAKIRHTARKLNMFEEHLLGGLFIHSNGFFQNFFVEHQFCQDAEFPCRKHRNSTRKP